MRRAALLALVLMAAGDVSAETAGRVASIDLCADILAARVMEPDRIAGLSPQARDPRLSAAAREAEALPTLPLSSESLLLSGADVVAVGQYGGDATKTLLKKLGIRTVTVSSDNDFDSVVATIRRVGKELGAAENAEALAADVERRRALLMRRQPEAPPIALYLRASGGSSAAGTFVDAALTTAGYVNLASRMGKEGWTRFDLETLAMSDPDVVVLGFFDAPFGTTMHRFSTHRGLKTILSSRPVVALPSRWLTCGGWPLIEAAEFLAATRSSLLAAGDAEERKP